MEVPSEACQHRALPTVGGMHTSGLLAQEDWHLSL